ncbi:MAG: hypothetical protein U0324_22995 [Polyangiales bacterium]
MAAKTTWAAVLCAATVALAGRAAHATHPDYEGERGLELSLFGGIGGAFTHDEGVFLPTTSLPRAEFSEPYDSFGPSFAGDLAAGWRFAPYVSAGLRGGYQALTTANVFTSAEAGLGPTDTIRAFHVGAYGRVYPMAFFNGSRHNPRVFFDSWGDRRRFEPWLSVGVEYMQFHRGRTYGDVRFQGSSASWTTHYLGIPVGVGVEYRLFQPLAVGLGFTVTPLVAGGADEDKVIRQITTGSDTTSQSARSYAPAADANAAFSVTLNVRYTLTLGE